MDDFENAFPLSHAIPIDPDVTFLNACVKLVDVNILGDDTMVRLLLEQGVDIKFHNLIREEFSKKIALHLPLLQVACLAIVEGQGQGDEDVSWAEVGVIDSSLRVTIFGHTSDWQEKRATQQTFIKENDELTYRCPFLYEDEDDMQFQGEIEFRQQANQLGMLHVPPFALSEQSMRIRCTLMCGSPG
jgi:hypothetical protein